jgi:enoyl-CoA hydratase/carnithine racemase
LALACHFRIMADNPKASIGLTELNLGIIPGWGGCVRMCRQLGRTKALDMILFSRKLNAPDALALGLVDKVVPQGEALKEALAMAEIIAQRPPIAVKFVLKAMKGLMNQNIDEGLRWESEGVKTTAASKDAAEGFTAFFEKRAPAFTGE